MALAEKQVVALDDDKTMPGETTRAEAIAISRDRSKTGIKYFLIGRTHGLDDIEKAADIEGFRNTLAGQQTAFDENGIVHMEAIHRQDFRSFALRLQRLGEIVRHGGFAGAGRTGNGDQETLGVAGAADDLAGDIFDGDAHAATGSVGTDLAPVMKATASDIVYSFGLITVRRAAEPVDMDAVGHLEDMRHVVRDQHDRHAARAHVEDQFQHLAAFLDAERGRRLVHDDDLGAERRGARHGHALALTAGKRFDRLVDVLDRSSGRVRQACRARAFPSPAGRACGTIAPSTPGFADLAAEEHVVGDRQRRRKREVLIDGLDAGVARLHRRLEVDLLALQRDLALIRA